MADADVTAESAPTASGARSRRRFWPRVRAYGGIRRAIHLLLVLLLVTFGTFMLLQLAPQDPAVAILGDQATPEGIAQIHRQLGLDRPVFDQYRSWLGNAAQGDLGKSLVAPHGAVGTRIAQALPISLELSVLGELIALAIAIPVAVWSAYRESGWFDRVASRLSFGFLSVPVFVSGLVFALLFSLHWRILPRAGWVRLTSPGGVTQNLRHAIMPAFVLALPLLAVYTRVLRAETIETLGQDHILAARATGLPMRRVLFRYALRPSSLSLMTLSGVSLGYLIGGTVLVETIYGLPGLGRVLAGAVGANDYPTVQGVVLVVATAYVLINLVIDLLYPVLDPRIRHGRA